MDAPNAAAIIFLWRRYFEEQAQLQAKEQADTEAEEATPSSFQSTESQELRRDERLAYYLRLKGETGNRPLSLATVAHQGLQQRVSQDEERVLRPNLQVPVDHDRAMYLAQ